MFNGKKIREKLQAYRAGTILSMVNDQPPLRDGVLITDGERILELTTYRQARKLSSLAIHDLGPSVMVPGLINAHTHLELRHLKGRTVAGRGFTEWVKSLIELPLREIDHHTLEAVREGFTRSGTVGVGDISGHSPRSMFAFFSGSGLFFHLFVEQIGFSPNPNTVVPSFKGLHPEGDRKSVV